MLPTDAAPSATVAAAAADSGDEARLRTLLRRARATRAARDVVTARAAGGVALASALCAHGRCLLAAGDGVGAAAQLCDALDACGGAANAADARALAAFWLRAALAGHALPAAPSARAQAALALADGGAAAVPVSYVRRLFDGYAPTFDAHISALGYSTPAALAALAVDAARAAGCAAPAWRRCVDLGCGTGLSGAPLRPLAAALVGVDVSARMLDAARARAPPLYDALHAATAEDWLRDDDDARGADLVAAADVLVYVAALDAVMAGAARVLARAAPAGDGDHRLFVFSTEALVEDDGAGGGGGGGDDGGGGGGGAEALAGFRVTAAGRCAHARAYVESVAARHGLAVCASRRIVLRQNAGRDVLGDIFAAGLAAEGRRGGLKSE